MPDSSTNRSVQACDHSRPQPSDGRMTQNRTPLLGLSRSADMSTTIGRDHVVNLVIGNRHPFAIHFDFVVVANHATLGRATIHHSTNLGRHFF